MYEEYFKLSAAPFRLNPDPKFFYGSRSHNKAMAYLHYGLRQGEGFIVVTGEIGAGKSMLIGHLIDQLDRTNVVAAHLVTANLEPSHLLAHILSAFRIKPSGAGKSAEFEAFEDFLYDQMNRGRRVLLIVDEAQNLPVKTIEELRMLSNMNYEGTPLFQVFLVGQPQFRTILADPDMEQFRQRVIASYHLDPLTAPETREYVRHRLSVVGWTTDPAIAEGAYDAVHRATGGLPRKINKLFNRILLHCATEKLHAIDAGVVAAVSADLDQENLERAAKAPPARAETTAAEVQPPLQEEPVAAGAEEAVVLPFAAKRGNPPATALKAVETPARPAAPDQPPGAVEAPGGTMFDRLRARRLGTAPAEEAPAGATLKDVAEAIAAASAADDVAPQEADAAPRDDAAPAPLAVEPATGWSAPIVRALGETRDDLKSAHDGVQRLRRQMSDFDRCRREKRQKIAANLSRAESLLAEIRNAWR